MRKRTRTDRYDTDTAKVIGSKNGVTLYRKTNGEYFTATAAGITPLAYMTAKVWGADNLPTEVYRRQFGDVDSSGPRKTYTFRLSAGAYELVKREAGQTGETLSDVVERAIFFLIDI